MFAGAQACYSEDRLAGIDTNNDGTAEVTYVYDSAGNRVAKLSTGGNEYYLIDPNNLTGYTQVLEEKSTPSGTPTRSYWIGQDVIAQAVDAVVDYLLYDGHGSTRALLDATGQVATGQVYAYDAFGNAIGFDAANAATRLLYTGEWFDPTSGWYHLRARQYIPSIGRFPSSDSYEGRNGEPLTLHKYSYTHANPINCSDPTGLWTVAGVMIGVTIAATLGSLLLPALGAAYLCARGKLSPMRILGELGRPEVWAGAAYGLVVGSGVSLAIQGGLMKLVSQGAAKKIIPGVGMVFALVGLAESVRLTYELVTMELPPKDAERFVATLIAGSVLSTLLAVKMRQWARQAQRDTSYWNMSAQDQAAYNAGQQLLPAKVWNEVSHMSPVEKGNYLINSFGYARRQVLRLQGLWESVLNFGSVDPHAFTTLDWIGTGLTPELRFMLGTNMWSVFGTVVGLFGLDAEGPAD